MLNKTIVSDLLHKPGFKISIILGSFGFFISFIIVLIKGGEIHQLILRPLASSVIMILFWNVGYLLLQQVAPELIKEIKKSFSNSASDSSRYNEDSGDLNFELDQFDKDSDESGNKNGNKQEKISEDIELNSNDENDQPVKSTANDSNKKKQRAGGDEILVQGVAIKKDPELMARTIQHVLDTDKE
ncbi:MAG: hypothetical protein OEV78_04830 [Spirochaetia bacterium]|nr:hypothetical protein [Spirochaetia bacterium]